ncbi:MAG: hypothetical protein HY319_25125 [Armatimonadetes bacterium]|nr:hypothetical protein [Armatimonadota bacterium]
MARALNGPEQMVLLHLLTPAAHVFEVHPHKLGVSCPVVQEPAREWHCLVLRKGSRLLVVYPQVEIEVTPGRLRRLDFLVVVRVARSQKWIDLEVDGPSHQTDRDRERDEQVDKIGIQPLRYPTEAVVRAGFRVCLLRRLVALASA